MTKQLNKKSKPYNIIKLVKVATDTATSEANNITVGSSMAELLKVNYMYLLPTSAKDFFSWSSANTSSNSMWYWLWVAACVFSKYLAIIFKNKRCSVLCTSVTVNVKFGEGKQNNLYRKFVSPWYQIFTFVTLKNYLRQENKLTYLLEGEISKVSNFKKMLLASPNITVLKFQNKVIMKIHCIRETFIENWVLWLGGRDKEIGVSLMHLRWVVWTKTRQGISSSFDPLIETVTLSGREWS